MTRVLGLAFTVLLASWSVEAAARCSVPFIQTFDNQTANGSMQADSGKPCRIRLRNSPGPMLSVEIMQRPVNGSVRIAEANSVIYTSRAGYVGSDAFIYARRGQTTTGAAAVRTVRIAVTVR
jgi:hypothetical protein